jgi:hypothetical protein
VSRAPRRHQGREAAYQFEAAIVGSPSPITAPVTFPLGRCANRTRTRSSRVHSTIPKMQQGSLPALFPGVRSPSIPELHDFVHLRGFHVALQRKEKKNFAVVQVTEHLCVLEHRAAGTLTTAPCGLLMGDISGRLPTSGPSPCCCSDSLGEVGKVARDHDWSTCQHPHARNLYEWYPNGHRPTLRDVQPSRIRETGCPFEHSEETPDTRRLGPRNLGCRGRGEKSRGGTFQVA